MFAISDCPLENLSLRTGLQGHQSGAFVSFEGWVRDHNEGRAVKSLEYEAFQELAFREGEKIVQEAKKIMRHSKRDYLTQADIRLALKKLNFGESSSNLLLGYPSHVPFQFVKMGQTQG